MANKGLNRVGAGAGKQKVLSVDWVKV